MSGLPRRLRSGVRNNPNQTDRNMLEAVHIVIKDNDFPVGVVPRSGAGVSVTVEGCVRHWLTFSVRRGHADAETGQPVFVPVLDYCTMGCQFHELGNLGRGLGCRMASYLP